MTPVWELLKRSLESRLTGALELSAGRVRRRVYFRDGLPIAVSSNLVREHILGHLLREAVLDDDLYKEHLTRSHGRRWRFGQSLSAQGVLTEEALGAHLQTHSQQLLNECFDWDYAAFSFHSGGFDALSGAAPLDPFTACAQGFDSEAKADLAQLLPAGRLSLGPLGQSHLDVVSRLLEAYPALSRCVMEGATVETAMDALEGEGGFGALLALYRLGVVLVMSVGIRARSSDSNVPSKPPPSVWTRPARRPRDNDAKQLSRIFFRDGLAFLKLGDHIESEEHFALALKRDPQDQRCRAYLGWVRFLIADDDEGRGRGSEMLVEAHRVVPDDDEVCVLVGHLYARTGSSSKGAEMYKRALNLNPANSEAVRALEPLA